MSYLNPDPEKTTLELLNDIRVAAMSQSHMPGLPLAAFAALLVRLSKEASDTADINLSVQRSVKFITIVVLLISLAQLAVAILQFKWS
jgi:hypothetical protein